MTSKCLGVVWGRAAVLSGMPQWELMCPCGSFKRGTDGGCLGAEFLPHHPSPAVPEPWCE